MDSRAKDLIIQNIPLLKELTEKLSAYQVVKIDLQRIIYFISQFETYERIELIIKLIQNIDFIDSNRMTFLLRRAFEKIPVNLKSKPLISSLGSIQDSSAVVCYQLLKQLFDSEEATLNLIADVNSIGKSLENENPSSIIFFDDNITSGTQLADFFEELIEGKAKAEMVKTPLTVPEYELLKKTPIRVCYAIQLTEESNNIVSSLKTKYNIDLEIHSGKVDFNNHLDFQSNTMKSEHEAKFAREFIREISEPLYQDKNWSDETVYNRLLGYGNLGKLTVFYYNVPKSLIPVFWKYGNYNGKSWIPLFPETQQQKKIIENNIQLEYYQLEAINSWINSIPQNRKPNLMFGISTHKGVLQEITLEIPSQEIIQETFKKYLNSKKQEYEANHTTLKTGDINSLLANIYPTTSLNATDYNKYKKAVDHYNQQLDDYYNHIKKYIYRQSSNIEVIMQLSNSGNIAATNCNIKLIYNTGELVFDVFDDLPKPAFEYDKPIMKDFDSTNTYARIIVSMPNLEIHSLLGGKKRDPISEDTDYEYKIFSTSRVGHNDSKDKTVEITRMNIEENHFRIPYEINFDEEAETLKGIITINYIETQIVNEKLKERIYKSFDKLKLKSL